MHLFLNSFFNMDSEFDLIKAIELGTNAAATLLAAFFGSWYAFKLNREAAAQEKMEAVSKADAIAANQEIASANRALFQLGRQYNTLLVLREQLLENFRDNPARHILLRPIALRDYSGDYLDHSSLQFLLDKERGDLLFSLLLENDRFINAIATIDSRSRYHDQTIQPTLEKLGSIIEMGLLHKMLGERATVTITNYTDDVYRFVDECINSIEQMMLRFHNEMKSLYPSAKFITVSTDPAYKKKS